MKLALVHLLHKTTDHPPLGLAYIAAYLRKYMNFDNTVILDREKDYVKKIKQEKPDIVGISAMTVDIQKAKSLAQDIKSNFDLPVVLGGVHISTLPVLPKDFDIGVIGEGEQTMLELIQLYEKHDNFPKEELKKIKGIIFYDNGSLKTTDQRPLIQDLDTIPFPARDLLDMEYYLKPKRIVSGFLGRGTHMLSSRGCPYRCVFCSTTNFWKRYRTFSPEHVVGEIAELVKKYKVELIMLYDDLFAAKKERVEAICRLMKEHKLNEKVELYCSLRTDTINEEICKLLKEMNVTSVTFGLESGSPKILSYLKKNTTTVEQNRNAVLLCKKYGIFVFATFMIGSPNETKEDVQKTMEFIKDTPFDTGAVYSTTPLPGTELWDYALKENFVSSDMDFGRLDIDVSPNLEKNIVINKTMSKEQIWKYYVQIKHLLNEKTYTHIKIRPSDFLNPTLIRRAWERKGELFHYFKNRIVKH